MNKDQLLELIRECVNEVIQEAQPIQNRLQSLNIHIDNTRKSMSDPTLSPERKSKLSASCCNDCFAWRRIRAYTGSLQ